LILVRCAFVPPFRFVALAAAFVVLAFLAGCAGPGVIVRPDDRPGMPAAIFSPKPVLTQHGKASFYWEDSRTASGERFHSEALTAAHRTFPLQSWVRVTNERNHKWVIVRINDRGPYVRGRIIDLSRGAARQIGMIGDGVVPVRVELLKRINVVEKPNLKLTPKIRQQAEARLQQRLHAKKLRQTH
jgi:rare lipoprotein A